MDNMHAVQTRSLQLQLERQRINRSQSVRMLDPVLSTFLSLTAPAVDSRLPKIPNHRIRNQPMEGIKKQQASMTQIFIKENQIFQFHWISEVEFALKQT